MRILCRTTIQYCFVVIFSFSIFPFPLIALAQTATSSATTGENTPRICGTLGDNLKKGNTDEETYGAVTALQDFLFDTGYYPHPGVGEFGWLTFYGLARFQGDSRLPSTGFFGPMTRAYISETFCAVNADTDSVPPLESVMTADASSSTPPEIIEAPVTPETLFLDTALSSSSPSIKMDIKERSLPYRNSAFFDEWQGDWGEVSTSSAGTLVLRATASTTGATALLPDSYAWTDYSYTTDVTVNANGTFSLIGRYADGKNFLMCTFANRSVKITEVLNGIRRDVASARLSVPSYPAILISTNVMMKTKGNYISCSATGAEDVSYTISDPRLLAGGIGVSIWHSVLGITSLELRSVRVDPL